MAEDIVENDDLDPVGPEEIEEEGAEDTEEIAEEDGVPAEPEPKASRAQDRIRALSEESRREREARQQAEQRAELLERQQREAQEAARRAQEMEDESLPYEQRLHRWAARRDQEFQNQLRMTQAQLMDQSDKTQYELRAATDPRFKKYASRVEERLTQMRAAGTSAPREAVLKYLIGEDALSDRGRSNTAKQKSAASSRVSVARGEPVRARSDIGTRAQRVKSLEERLSDQPL